jgi:hypothetical protein
MEYSPAVILIYLLVWWACGFVAGMLYQKFRNRI